MARALAAGKTLRHLGATLGAALIALALAAALLRRIIRNPAWMGMKAAEGGETPLPRPYARLLRRLDAAGYRRTSGATLEEVVRKALENRSSLAEDASRLLALYHRDRFGVFPLPPADVREADRLAFRLGREIGRRPAT
jgi:hypothetical protein